ncbi:RNA cap guanine-N2 methyltransferase [Fragilaria crotonensis]|nr:RNA cap guanine-N2 methyltransferase [Fragilaria crotonensis]
MRPEVSLVIAVDCDREKLEMAANNAAAYDVASEKIVFIHGNASEALLLYKDGKRGISKKTTGTSCDLATAVEIDHGFKLGGMDLLPEFLDSVFLSPPWGGLNYETCGKRNYHIETCIEVSNADGLPWNGEEILLASATATAGSVVYFLPRNINGISFGRSALKAKYRALEMEQNILMDKLKTVTAYLGL